MNSTRIPYQKTGYFSKLIIDYLEEKERLEPFYNLHYNIESFTKAIDERKKKPVNRTSLVNALSKQYEGFETSQKVKSNILNLKDENCFTVTTGHQLNLFTGPLYFIYKVVSTINLAKKLKEKFPENEFVPVYWMATEDHDFEEINHFNLFDKRYQLAAGQSGAVGKMKLLGIDELFSSIRQDLGDRNGVEEVLTLFSNYYTSDKTFSESIKGIVNHLFGDSGLVIIDGDDEVLKQLMYDEFKTELIERKNHQLINATVERLKTLGYKPQLTPREINLFYLNEHLRERIVFEEDCYKVLHTEMKFSEAEILEELTKHPERFSPNAPMRCMYQEKVLPNIAYIGGGGELAYWLQLKEMFDANNIFYPTLVLRNSVLVVDKRSNSRLSKLDVKPSDLFKDKESIIKEYIKKGAEIILELQEEEKIIEAVFDDLVKKAGSIDVTLQPMIKSELQKSLKSIKNIEGRLIKSEKKKEEVAVNQIKNLKEKLFPNGALQERHDNLFSLLLFYGDGVIEELLDHLNPLEKEFVILSEELG